MSRHKGENIPTSQQSMDDLDEVFEVLAIDGGRRKASEAIEEAYARMVHIFGSDSSENDQNVPLRCAADAASLAGAASFLALRAKEAAMTIPGPPVINYYEATQVLAKGAAEIAVSAAEWFRSHVKEMDEGAGDCQTNPAPVKLEGISTDPSTADGGVVLSGSSDGTAIEIDQAIVG